MFVILNMSEIIIYLVEQMRNKQKINTQNFEQEKREKLRTKW